MGILKKLLLVFRRERKGSSPAGKDVLLYDSVEIPSEKKDEGKTDMIQSYILNAIENDLSLCEKRIVFRLFEILQAQRTNQRTDKDCLVSTDQNGEIKVMMPVSLLLSENKEDPGSEIREALRLLLGRKISYEEDGMLNVISLIERPKITNNCHSIVFRLHGNVHEALISLSGGYQSNRLEEAVSFRSIYTERFYRILKGKQEPVRYTVSELRTLLSLGDKYKKMASFLCQVIDKAKKELDRKGSFSFTYQLEYGKVRGKKITAIVFTTVILPAKQVYKTSADKESRKSSSDEISFRSVYTKRFYELLNGKKETVTYSTESLRSLLGVEDKYRKMTVFLDQIVDKAKKELDQKCTFSFTYEPEYEQQCSNPKGGRRRITGLTVTKIYHPGQQEDILSDQTNQQQTDSEERSSIRNILKNLFRFSEEELDRLTELVLRKGGNDYITKILSSNKGNIEKVTGQLREMLNDKS